MATFVALLRAVNVGGRTLPMADVRRSLETLGLGDVRTYLQSGNVVFEGGHAPAEEYAAAIEVRIERELGPRVAVLVLTGDQMAEVAARNPFVAEPDVEPESLHATFVFTASGEDDFGQAPTEAYSAVYGDAFRKLELPLADGERAAFVGVPPLATPVVYLYLPHGYGRTKLNNAFFERKLGTGATTRNWRTVKAVAEMATGSRGEDAAA
jgi:uncharacterized protein (DUF1697 family)